MAMGVFSRPSLVVFIMEYALGQQQGQRYTYPNSATWFGTSFFWKFRPEPDFPAPFLSLLILQTWFLLPMYKDPVYTKSFITNEDTLALTT